MVQSIRALDRLLRGDVTRLDMFRRGTFDLPVVGLAAIVVLLAAIYGACMGMYGLTTRAAGGGLQWGASVLKVPMLFVLTVAITLPSLYVFNSLVGSRLKVSAVVKLLVAFLALNLAVLASMGPIVAFFSVTTTSYPFMVLLNAAAFAGATLLGLRFLLQTLYRLTRAAREQTETEGGTADSPRVPPVAGTGKDGAAKSDEAVRESRAKRVFYVWLLMFMVVGAQMGWVLRPFIGNPAMPFSFFRPKGSSVIEGIVTAVIHLAGW